MQKMQEAPRRFRGFPEARNAAWQARGSIEEGQEVKEQSQPQMLNGIPVTIPAAWWHDPRAIQ